MCWRAKANVVRDLGNRPARLLQKRDRTLEPAENDVPMRCHTPLSTERPDEVVNAQARGAGQLVQRGRMGRRVVEVGDDQVVDTAPGRAAKTTVRAPGRLLSAKVPQPGCDTMDTRFEEEQIVRVTSRRRNNELHSCRPQFAIMRVEQSHTIKLPAHGSFEKALAEQYLQDVSWTSNGNLGARMRRQHRDAPDGRNIGASRRVPRPVADGHAVL